MKTKIFKSYSDFLERENKDVNGVSESFSVKYPDYQLENITNKGCWNYSGCQNCGKSSYLDDCNYCRDCQNCENCSNCRDLSNCQND